MWKVILLGIVAVVATAEQSSAEDVGSWCSHEDIGGGSVVDRCHFESYAECRAATAGLGGIFCTQNQYYVAPPPVARQPEPVAAQPAARRVVAPKKPEPKKPNQPN